MSFRNYSWGPFLCKTLDCPWNSEPQVMTAGGSQCCMEGAMWTLRYKAGWRGSQRPVGRQVEEGPVIWTHTVSERFFCARGWRGKEGWAREDHSQICATYSASFWQLSSLSPTLTPRFHPLLYPCHCSLLFFIAFIILWDNLTCLFGYLSLSPTEIWGPQDLFQHYPQSLEWCLLTTTMQLIVAQWIVAWMKYSPIGVGEINNEGD